jgi:hypothetical protein
MIFNYTNAKLDKLAVHFVGNKHNDEPIHISSGEIENISNELKSTLLNYFISGFKSYEVFNFWHESELKLNNINSFISEIFEDKRSFFIKSINISKHLYEHSLHPNIKGGELYISVIENCIIDEEVVDVIAIIKSENKESFLKVNSLDNNYRLEIESGLNLNKVDKGCLIFNQKREEGYKVLLIDNLNKSSEAHYWKNDFLRLKPSQDNYHFTNDYLSLTKQFVTQQLSEEFELNKAKQVDLLNKSVDYFKKKEKFNETEFVNEVLKDSDVTKSFHLFKEEYQQSNDIEIEDNFDISAPAVKKQSKLFKSVIKLDKNFHIYVHGNKEYIEKGVDEATGLNYYKIYFKTEN